MMEEGSCMAIRYVGWCVRAKVRVRANNAKCKRDVYSLRKGVPQASAKGD